MTVIDEAVRGWKFAGRAAAYLKRRSREAGPLWRGMRILQRYTAHYRRARRIYGPPATPPTTTVYDVGVQVVDAHGQGFLRLPSDFQSKVADVGRSSRSRRATRSQSTASPLWPSRCSEHWSGRCTAVT
jgi:hypothetical protein